MVLIVIGLSRLLSSGCTMALLNNYLVVQLYEQLLIGAKLAIGAVEMASILKDQVTVGVFVFPEIDDPPGKLEVNITPDMDDPIEVTLSGLLAAVYEGLQSMYFPANL